ncbi:hypothetical protein GLAREA_05581 [Glarea lozoyensis ATCC 20868]|uniref:Uncharacterized protein n=2 Tax=Glarea lozoyensis TaxID=101852 RepID=S3ED68_GLAL2|nr:uncharacterized protein GLAREA_05581 [Glarea lozoyensis ATCC 20868]EHK98895.1 hypothetical protein M7I_5405 [Glarea lozoyensis 74030]EPE36243.1 hypothetical protein GLAREA_05581 [Glarea lozoyensis ATCC 20868]
MATTQEGESAVDTQMTDYTPDGSISASMSMSSSVAPEDSISSSSSSIPLAIAQLKKKTPARRPRKSTKEGGRAGSASPAKRSPGGVTKKKSKSSRPQVKKPGLADSPQPAIGNEDEPSNEIDADGEFEENDDDQEEQEDSAQENGEVQEDPLSVPKERRSKWKKKGQQPDPNGRFRGRKLVMWHRPRMMEKLMLHVQYECQRQGVQIPWDKVVHRLSPGSSGATAQQHLNKIRDILVGEGHMVPPLIGKLGAPAPPDTPRGYVRDLSSDDPHVTRKVLWSEETEDLKESLVVPGVIRGSGAYRKYEVDVKSHVKRALSQLKVKEESTPEELAELACKSFKYESLKKDNTLRLGSASHKTKYADREEPSQKAKPRGAAKAGSVARAKQAEADMDDLEDFNRKFVGKSNSSKKTRVTKAPRLKVDDGADEDDDEEDEVDPAELFSDEEYTPGITSKPTTRSRRSCRKQVKYNESFESDVDDANVTPSKVKSRTDSEVPMTPPNTGVSGGQHGHESTQTMLSRQFRQSSIAEVSDSDQYNYDTVGTHLADSPSAMGHSRMKQCSQADASFSGSTQEQHPAQSPRGSIDERFQEKCSYQVHENQEVRHSQAIKLESESPRKMNSSLLLFVGDTIYTNNNMNAIVLPDYPSIAYDGMANQFSSDAVIHGDMDLAPYGSMAGVSTSNDVPQQAASHLHSLSSSSHEAEEFSQLVHSPGFGGSEAQVSFTNTWNDTDHARQHVGSQQEAYGEFAADHGIASYQSQEASDHSFHGLPLPASNNGIGFGWTGPHDDVFANSDFLGDGHQDEFNPWTELSANHQQPNSNYMGMGNFTHRRDN